MSDQTTISGETIANGESSTKDSLIFRNPVIQEAKERQAEFTKPDNVVTQSEKTKPEQTIDEYKEANGKEYIENVFDLGTPYDYLPVKVQEELTSINSYIKERMEEDAVTPTTKEFIRYLNEMRLELGLHVDSTIDNELDRMAGYAESMSRVNSVKDVQERIREELKRARSSKKMRRIVMTEIGKRIL